MHSYVRRTRPVLGFMDIGFALRGYRMLNDCPLNPGNSIVRPPLGKNQFFGLNLGVVPDTE